MRKIHFRTVASTTAIVFLTVAGCSVRRDDPPRVSWTHLSSASGELPLPPGGTEQTACVAGDVDGDGDYDFFIADRSTEPSLYLYTRNTGGWDRSVVDTQRLAIEAGGDMADIDGDGDLDLALGQDGSGTGDVWWWENPGPDLPVGGVWTRRLIKSGGRQAHDQGFGDFDGDGQTEFATWVNKAGRIEIFDIPGDTTTSPWKLAATIKLNGEGMDILDVDGDGITDLLAGKQWIQNKDGNAYAQHDIDPDYPVESARIVGGQFIPGGFAEVAISSGDGEGPLNFYRFDGVRWIRSILIKDVDHGHSLEAGDIDGDGNLDLFVAEMGSPGAGPNCKAWIGWGDGMGNFALEVLTVGIGNHESKLADLDGDGDLDIISKPYRFGAPRIDMFLNNGLNSAGSADDQPPPAATVGAIESGGPTYRVTGE